MAKTTKIRPKLLSFRILYSVHQLVSNHVCLLLGAGCVQRISSLNTVAAAVDESKVWGPENQDNKLWVTTFILPRVIWSIIHRKKNTDMCKRKTDHLVKRTIHGPVRVQLLPVTGSGIAIRHFLIICTYSKIFLLLTQVKTVFEWWKTVLCRRSAHSLTI